MAKKQIAHPQVVKQAENEAGSPQVETATESKRKQVSKRDFLLNGSVVDKIEEANAARYAVLGVTDGNVDSIVLGEPGKLATMCAIFGFHTKVGNVANTVLNDKDEPGTAADALAAIKEFIAQAEGGVWAERTTGGVGARVDKDALAGSVISVAVANGKFTAGSTEEAAAYTKVRDKLENEPAYVRACRQVPDVAREYATRVGKASKTVDDLLG